jgi:long-chain acyl-CoA synthetase
MTTTGRPTAPANASQPDMPWLTHYPRGVDWHMPLRVAPLYRLLDDAVAGYPELPCTNFLGKTLTYADIGELVAHATLGLQRLGVR